MYVLLLGLAVFLGLHSVRIVADGWRTRQIAAIGERRWKAIFSLMSAAGLVILIWGYGASRAEPIAVWFPPRWTTHVTALLSLPAFVLLAAAYVPRTRLRAAVGHPMVLGVKIWAFAHLISNGNAADLLLFGSFLAWAIADFSSARRRDRAAGVSRPPGRLSSDVLALVVGTLAWVFFAFLLHGPLIGVVPFG